MAVNESKEKCAFTFLWHIENFSRSAALESRIVGPLFPVKGFKSEWRLEMDPMGFERNDKCVSVSLIRIVNISSDPFQNPIDYEMSFLGAEDEPRVIGEARSVDFESAKTLEFRMESTEFAANRSSFLPMDTLSIQCRMWMSGIFDITGHCLARTGFSAKRSSIVWPIEGFGSLQLKEKKTCAIKISRNSVDKCSLNFSLVGASLSEARLQFEIEAYNNHSPPLVTMCEIFILDRSGNKVWKCAEAENKFSVSGRCQYWILSQSMTREDVLNHSFLEDDTLNVFCDCTFVTGEHNGEIERIHYATTAFKEMVPRQSVPAFGVDRPNISQVKTESVSALQEDFLSLYKEQQVSSDFELRSGDVSFPVHKNVLSVRSPVFRGMFSDGPKESDFQDVPDVDAHTLDRMLTFLYAGTVDGLEWESTLKLYYAADKYQVQSLKQECSSFLRSHFTVSNACDILVLANRHRDDELKSFAHDFVSRHFDDTMSSPEWGQFLEREVRLAGTTMHQIYMRKLRVGKKRKWCM